MANAEHGWVIKVTQKVHAVAIYGKTRANKNMYNSHTTLQFTTNNKQPMKIQTSQILNGICNMPKSLSVV